MMLCMALDTGRREISGKTKALSGAGLAVVAVAAVAGGLWFDSARSTDVPVDGTSQLDSPRDTAAPGFLEVPRPANNAPMFVTFLGDSITNSWGASTFWQGFRPQLTNEWAQNGRIDPVVTAVSGATLNEVAQVANIPAKSNLVVIELGTTDNGDVKTPPAVFRDQYKALIERVRTTAPDAAIVCLGTWRSQKEGLELDSIIAGECGVENAKYLTLRDLYSDTTNRGPEGRPIYLGGGVGDSFHPNDAGYAAIKQRIADYVQIVDVSDTHS